MESIRASFVVHPGGRARLPGVDAQILAARIVVPGSAEERALSGHIQQPAPEWRPYPNANETALGVVALFILLVWVGNMIMPDKPATCQDQEQRKNQHA